MKNDLIAFIKFLHEVGMLANTPRSGFAFLGSGKQSVAEHSYRMALTGFVLAEMVKHKQKVDQRKLLLMCLLHDLPESRISDLNYVNKKYVAVNEKKVIEEIQSDYPCVSEIKTLLDEYNEGSSIESQLAHDADQLELLLFLKRESELGNPKAMDWFDKSEQRLQTDEAKELAKEIRSTASDSWWLVNPDDPHWIKPSPNSI